MTPEADARIDALCRSDRLYAGLFVLVLWVVIGFVLYAMWGLIGDAGVRGVLVVAAALLLLFNTASISAMVRHAREDKAFIYGLDLKHLDALAASRAASEHAMRAATNRS